MRSGIFLIHDGEDGWLCILFGVGAAVGIEAHWCADLSVIP